MSRGTKLTPLRLSDELLARIRAAIDSNNARRAGEDYNVSTWIRQAIEERLAKLARGRKGKGRGGKGNGSNGVGLAIAGDQVEGEEGATKGLPVV